jgi:hypothetical protein
MLVLSVGELMQFCEMIDIKLITDIILKIYRHDLLGKRTILNVTVTCKHNIDEL